MVRFLFPTQRSSGTPENPFWISYADLMVALVMLFLVVMSISMVAVASKSMVEKKGMEDDIQGLLDIMDSEARLRGLDLTINRATHTISFGEKARFDHNSFQLSASAKRQLQGFVPLLLDVHATEKGQKWLKRVHIEGYTDATGSYLYNVNLSLNRAQAVVCTLLQADLADDQRRKLRQLLIIDGAASTAVKASPEESRRVEVRMEFRAIGDNERYQPVTDMPLGRCAIRLVDAPETEATEPTAQKRAAAAAAAAKAAREAQAAKAAEAARAAQAALEAKAAARAAALRKKRAREEALAARRAAEAAKREAARAKRVAERQKARTKPADTAASTRGASERGYGVKVEGDKVRVINDKVVNDAQKAAHKMQRLIQEQVRRNRERQNLP